MQKTIIITGANRGIGLALTKQFLQSNQWRIIACCRKPKQAKDLQKLKATSDKAITIHQLDVTDESSIKQFASAIQGQTIDVLLNNAGIFGGEHQSLSDMNCDAWIETLKVNTIAPFRMAQAVMENLKYANNPKIVTISSQMGSLNRKSTGHYAYRSSKAAVNKVMQTMAVDLEKENIIVSMIHPGWVKTDMGGHEAEISAQQSAEGISKVIISLEKSDTGRFFTWQGEEHLW